VGVWKKGGGVGGAQSAYATCIRTYPTCTYVRTFASACMCVCMRENARVQTNTNKQRILDSQVCFFLRKKNIQERRVNICVCPHLSVRLCVRGYGCVRVYVCVYVFTCVCTRVYV